MEYGVWCRAYFIKSVNFVGGGDIATEQLKVNMMKQKINLGAINHVKCEVK